MVPKYYAPKIGVNVTFCYTDSFVGNNVCASVNLLICTSFKLCVYEYERNSATPVVSNGLYFDGVRLWSLTHIAAFSLAHGIHLLIFVAILILFKAQVYHHLMSPNKSKC